MKRAILFLAVLGLFPIVSAASEPRVLVADKLDGKPGDGWVWLREDPKTWRVHDGAMEIRVEPGVAHNVKNALVRPAPQRGKVPYAVHVTVTFTAEPTNQYEQAGITWYQNGRPRMKLVHEHIDGKDYIIPGRVAAPEKTVELRLVVTADKFTAQFRPDAKGEFRTVWLRPLGAQSRRADQHSVLPGPSQRRALDPVQRFPDRRSAGREMTPQRGLSPGRRVDCRVGRACDAQHRRESHQKPAKPPCTCMNGRGRASRPLIRRVAAKFE